MGKKTIPRLTRQQREELARCYAAYCGVLEDDDVKGELASARKFIRDNLKFWGKTHLHFPSPNHGPGE